MPYGLTGHEAIKPMVLSLTNHLRSTELQKLSVRVLGLAVVRQLLTLVM